VGIKTHIGYSQEAHDSERVALTRALESASRRPTSPERITIFTDARAVIRRLALEEPGPGQQYALQAVKHIATLCKARPGITIEIWWCLAHKGVAGNENIDEWAKIAAEKPDARGVEWLGYSDRGGARAVPPPRSLMHLKWEISEEKGVEERQWAGGRTSKTKYRMPKTRRPGGTVSGTSKRLASGFYRLKTGHARIGQYLHWAKVRPPLSAVGGRAQHKRENTSPRSAQVQGTAEDPVGGGAEEDRKVEEPVDD